MAAIARTKTAVSPRAGIRATAAAVFCLVATSISAHAQTANTISNTIQELFTGTSQPPLVNRTTRFEILVPSRMAFKVQALRTPTNRVVVEIPTTRMVLPNNPTSRRKRGLIKTFRGGISAPGQSRVVIEVSEPVVVRKQEIAKAEGGNAHYIALELVPAATLTRAALTRKDIFTSPPSGLGAVGLQPPMPAAAIRPEQRIAKSYKPVIVIDPGHGGHDFGARKHGTVEKHVVLAFSKELRKQLDTTGRYKILMTRDSDEFVTLDGRRQFAEKNNAALFIAVHADYAKRGSARGATIYSLRSRVADRLRSSAKKRVSSAVLSSKELRAVRRTGSSGRVVRKILSDLAVREVDMTKQRTRLFSRTVIRNMGSATELRGKPHRSAAFKVLKTAKVPSVLIELAYVTNRRDAKNLKSKVWRKRVATSIKNSIDNYFSKMRHPTALASSDD